MNIKLILCIIGIFVLIISWIGLLYLYWTLGKPYEHMPIVFVSQIAMMIVAFIIIFIVN